MGFNITIRTVRLLNHTQSVKGNSHEATTSFYLDASNDFYGNKWSVHKDTCVSDSHCDIDLKGEVIFDNVATKLCEWIFIRYK